VLFPPAMRAADLETVFRIALPPLRLALRERYLRALSEVRRRDPIARRAAGAARLVELGASYFDQSRLRPARGDLRAVN
jgi:hypothetical protein